jgi:transposase InsO family protein
MLQPLLVHAGTWHTVSLEFVEGLPQSGSTNCILVIVDKFTKYAYFVPLKHPFTALSVAKLFIDNVYRLHGLPSVIISDRDRIFTSNLWRELFNLADVQLQMSSAYHPQSDGRIERVNQCMETFLRCFVNAFPKKWLAQLSLAEFWYNTSFHSAIGRTPFEALYGYTPHHFGVSADHSCAVDSLDEWLQERRLMTELIEQHLNRASVRMKHQTNKGRS